MNGIATKSTRIYETETGLSCNIPREVLPTPIPEEITYEDIIPGHRYTAPDWFYTTVEAYPDTTFLKLRHDERTIGEMIITYGLDPSQRIQIKPYGTGEWIDAHIFKDTKLLNKEGLYDPIHGVSTPIYGRVWLPKQPVRRDIPIYRRKTREYWKRKHDIIREYALYPVKVRGMTLPTKVTRTRWKDVRQVIIKYLDNVYPAVEYKEDNYRWDIPHDIPCYYVLEEALRIGKPVVQFYPYNYIYANFMFPGFEERLYMQIGRCYRSTSHIKIGVVDKRKYEFKFDIRSHYLSLCQQTYYVDPNGIPMPVSEALAWTNLRLLQAHPGLANIRSGFQTGVDLKRRKWDKRKKRMVRITLEPRYESTLEIEGEISKERPKDYIGTENVQISLGEAEEEYGEFYKFYYCTKEVEYYKPPDPPEKYDNARIEDTLIKLGARRIYTDDNGFIWLR